MITIYGLRKAGAEEIRYIGRSAKPLDLRLNRHIYNAGRGYPPAISNWIAKAKAVEIVPLAQCEAEHGCAVERALVEQYWSDGHRLTNSHLVPRTPSARTPKQGAAA